MKKIALTGLVIASSIFAAEPVLDLEVDKFEVKPFTGLYATESTVGIENNIYPMMGISFRANYDNSLIEPELTIYGGQNIQYEQGGSTNVIAGMFDAVYKIDAFNEDTKPYLRAGVGIVNYTNESYGNELSFTLNVGAGFDYSFAENWGFFTGVDYVAARNDNHAGNFDSGLMMSVGIRYTFNKPEIPDKNFPAPGKFTIKEKIKEKIVTNKKVTITLVKKQQAYMPLEEEVVHFDFDKYNLRESDKIKLDKIAEAVKDGSEYIIEINGHTDNIGTEKYNWGLGLKRANSVRHYLIEKQIVPLAIIIKSFGEEMPVADNSTAEGRAKNRRAEIKISEQKLNF